MKIIPFPKNKKFAFTFTDDTDMAKTENVRIIYNFINTIGIKATKTVWVFPSKRKSGYPEETGRLCLADSITANPEYLELVKKLKGEGHEIALHLASGGNNLREETIEAYNIFHREFHHYPNININHGRNADTIYWCKESFQHGIFRVLASLYSQDTSEGHIPDSPFFWGDYCKKYTRYVRLFKSLNLNTLRINPTMPYHDPHKPYVNRWFSATDLAEPWLVKKIVTEKNLKALIDHHGACIGYTYLHRFVTNNKTIDPSFFEAMQLLSAVKTECWFTPVSQLLDRLVKIQRLSIQKKNREYVLYNGNNTSVNDIWLYGKSGDIIHFNGSGKNKIGASGITSIERCNHHSTPTSRKNDNPALVPFFELNRMVYNQILLLLIRHLHGRTYFRQGW